MRYLVKVAMFGAFLTLLYFTIGLITQHLTQFISAHWVLGNNTIYILHKLKICEAVNIYISAVIASWIINKIINYWSG